MEIALVIDRISNRSGGAEKVVVTLANELAQYGFKVTLLTWEPNDDAPFYPMDKRVRIVNLMPIRERRRMRSATPGRSVSRRLSRSAQSNPWFARPLWWAEHGIRIQQLRSYFVLAQPAVAIGFLPSSFPYVVEAAKGTDVKVVSSCHNVPERDFDDRERWSNNAFDIVRRRRALQNSHAVTCLLEKFVPYFERAKATNLHVIPNFVDIPDISEMSFERTSKVIIVVGRMAPQKDHATLLRAWRLIARRYPDWVVHLYGTGPLRRDLYALHGKLALGKSFVFKGETKEIEKAYRNAEIFCIPSIHEGFGLVTAEAMANGLPVVGFDDCDGTNDIVTHGVDGLLASGHGDRAANLAAALATLMDDADRRRAMGRAGYENVHRFSKSLAMQGWVGLLASLGISLPDIAQRPEPDFDVTVAIPVYNGEDEIGQSLQSLAHQTFNGTLEVLIYNDGSTDSTLDVIEGWRAFIPGLRVIGEAQNRGRPFARQRLLEDARGRYLTWLDADDVKAPTFIAEHVSRLRELEAKHPNHVCATYCYYDIDYPNKNRRKRTQQRDPDKNFLVQLLTAKFEAYLWIFMMRTEDARMFAFDQSLPRLQDLDYFIQFALHRPVMARTKSKQSLCTYNKNDKGRVVKDIHTAWYRILEKYRYIFAVLGPGFTFNYVTHAIGVTSRYARINGHGAKALRLRATVAARRAFMRSYVKAREIARL